VPRIPLQVLVLPFRQSTDGTVEYAIFRRAHYGDDCWQGLAGGAEVGESAEQAAQREAMEEAGIPVDAPLIPLDAVASIPAAHFGDRHLWGPDLYVVTERAFGLRLDHRLVITLSREHTDYRWVAHAEAARLLRWDSNRTALWELNERLTRDRGLASS
jgi:dihydroneopterin triphosphate diphosphatase